jgi:hypothetical protein
VAGGGQPIFKLPADGTSRAMISSAPPDPERVERFEVMD